MSEALQIVGLVLAAAYPLAAFWAGGHALLNAEDPRSAWGWIAVCLLFPLAGALLYYLFGISRLKRRARKLLAGVAPVTPREPAGLPRPQIPEHLAELARTAYSVSQQPAVPGNRIDTLRNADTAYPSMLDAIEGARNSVWLTTYIFQRDVAGRAFGDALGAAVARGVEARVLIDGIGELYGLSLAAGMLRRRGVKVALFMPPRLFPPMLHINLRNHRKLLVVDGEIAFTGGMNIADYHMVEQPRVRKPVQDMHFRLRGPVVAQMAAVFAEDWRVATREALPLPPVPQAYRDGAMCRVITDGPDEDLDKLELILVAAISQARRRVCIMTPYFIPSHELASAMKAAALRGVDVDIVLPQRSNLRFVDWATRHQLAPLLQHGVRVYQQAPPFAHSKLLVVDDAYAQIGTANIDPRSLRLNFELAVEIYDTAIAGALAAPIDAARANSVPVTLAALNGRRLPARLRDAFFWLFSPYL